MDKNDKSQYYQLPYRTSVGMIILNQENKVFVAKRDGKSYKAWQMPQGGIHLGETPSTAVLREMKEELGTNNGVIIAESKKWHSYNLPKELIPKLWNGNFRGQKQKWFLIRFTGEDSEINIDTQVPEFTSWKWIAINEMAKNIIPFKYKLYKSILDEFGL
ncbi:MAG: RNA pyrophosphohydrolase [Rickettsiaceae bacterium]